MLLRNIWGATLIRFSITDVFMLFLTFFILLIDFKFLLVISIPINLMMITRADFELVILLSWFNLFFFLEYDFLSFFLALFNVVLKLSFLHGFFIHSLSALKRRFFKNDFSFAMVDIIALNSLRKFFSELDHLMINNKLFDSPLRAFATNLICFEAFLLKNFFSIYDTCVFNFWVFDLIFRVFHFSFI